MENEKPLYQRANEFIQKHIKGCNFVGVTDDGELLISYDSWRNDNEICSDASYMIESLDEILKVTIVERLDITKAKEMIIDLNKMLESEEKPASPLLNIGKF